MSLWLLAFLPPFTAALLLLRLLGAPPWRSLGSILCRASLATGLALGVTSCTYFAWLAACGSAGAGYVATEALLFAACAAGCGYRLWARGGRALRFAAGQGPRRSARLLLGVAFVAVAAVALADLLQLVAHNPHGAYDSVLLWNLRARFLYRGDARWTDVVSDTIHPVTHPDYPLLLPATVARLWTYQGHEDLLVRQAVTVLFTLALAGLLIGAVGLLRGTSQGLAAGMVLLGTPFFLVLASAQVADVPLGLYFLGTVVGLVLHERSDGDRRGWLCLAGLMAGLAAWTKNEGILFLGVVVLAWKVSCRDRGWQPLCRDLVAFGLGLAPVLVVVIYFKLWLAPPNDILAGQGAATWARLSDPARYRQIASAYLQASYRVLPALFLLLPAYFVLLGRPPRSARAPGAALAALTAGLMLAGYGAVYLVTPHYLGWHLETSLDRLLVQLWPLVLFAFFLVTATPEEALERRRPARQLATAQPPAEVQALSGTAR